MRCVFVRYTPMTYTLMRYMPMRCVKKVLGKTFRSPTL
jgi:hypothetical protein